MKRSIIAAAIAAATLITPAAAMADTPRYQTQDVEFSVTQPSGAGGLWTHDFKVTTNPCDDTFEGKGVVNGLDYDGPKTFKEVVKGSFDGDTVSLKVSRDFLYVNSWSLTDAPMNGSETQGASDPAVPWTLMFKVSPKVVTDTSDYKNHGQYVKAMGGGADAAHSCIGMPIKSSK